MKLRYLSLPIVLGSLWFSSAGCKAGTTTGNTGGGGSAATGTSITSVTDANVAATGGFVTSVTTTGQNGVGGGCAATSVATQLVPLDIVVILDESGSMEGAKWDGVTAALKTFVQDPTNDGLGVGIVYFPNFQADDCNYLDYENLNVPIGALPGNAPALVSSINGESPQGSTPTYGALKGGLFRATAYQDAHPDHKVIVVFASDGDPTECDITDIPGIAALAASAYNYNGVQTYVIAMAGATLANLDQIAAAGGTGQSYDVTTSVTAFSQKMQDIRKSALSCEFVIPPAPMGQTLDPTLVNVNYTPGGSTSVQGLPKADDLADCGTSPGWYYDNPTNPTKIEICPASCATIQADGEAKVDVAFGCVTVPN